ncbi:hypothetical protein [Sphingobacterium daejeonense]|uniref:hypothetical protein n=1 Tax=Sphingobacterium daejeonense TaxID=371142 RepID=UPI0010C2E3E1|nr:hypothetical protein [Sphingobacterium daejeonense]VTP90768.1 Uncharacterised protein [Sphingobacterium daejeonense]
MKEWLRLSKEYGSERIMVNSAADWGISDPLAVPKTAALMLQHGISREDVEKVLFPKCIGCFSS